MSIETFDVEFWMVWSPQGEAPTHKHWTYEGATNEADRLARKFPGRRFYVLKAIDVLQRVDVQRIALKSAEEIDVPF